MRKHLGFQASQVDALVGIETGMRRRAVDIRGENYGIVWHHLRTFAFAALAVGLTLRNVVPVRDGEIPTVPTVLVYLSAVAFGVAFLGRLRTRRYTWVECKDLRRPVSRRDIRRLNDAVEEVRAWDAARWKPARVLVVAGRTGFDRTALALAKSLSIECYRRANAGFERAM